LKRLPGVELAKIIWRWCPSLCCEHNFAASLLAGSSSSENTMRRDQ